jgi:hypothetical protein
LEQNGHHPECVVIAVAFLRVDIDPPRVPLTLLSVACGWRRGGRRFSPTSQHRLKVVLIHAQFDAPIEENGPCGLG